MQFARQVNCEFFVCLITMRAILMYWLSYNIIYFCIYILNIFEFVGKLSSAGSPEMCICSNCVISETLHAN
jgi:hypothetical protein